MFRVGLITKNGEIYSKTFEKLEDCYEFILKFDYKRFRILDIKQNKIVDKENKN